MLQFLQILTVLFTFPLSAVIFDASTTEVAAVSGQSEQGPRNDPNG